MEKREKEGKGENRQLLPIHVAWVGVTDRYSLALCSFASPESAENVKKLNSLFSFDLEEDQLWSGQDFAWISPEMYWTVVHVSDQIQLTLL